MINTLEYKYYKDKRKDKEKTKTVARVAMQIFDIKWRKRLEEEGVVTWLLARYMDDARAFLPPFRPGWRWGEEGLKFCQLWVKEDRDLTPTELTKRVLAGSMVGVERFLEFTFETCEDEQFNGWLPTLDTCLRVENNNVVNYNYYEKETCAKMTVQAKSAMNENMKIQIVSQDMIRRLLNTREEMGATNRGAIVDGYARKLLQSGYSKEQTRKIIKNGIKGFEGRRRSRAAKGAPMRSTAKKSSRTRLVKKLLSKTNWYRKRSNKDVAGSNNTNSRKGAMSNEKEQDREPQTVLFVEYSKDGELASSMKELTKRLSEVTGFKVKVVERAGGALRDQFPTTTLWDGSSCDRMDCTTCNQGAEKLPNCRKSSLVYENVCLNCNPGAGSKGELKGVRDDIPTLYVGETSRTVFERSKEHWEAWRSRKEESHIRKHQELEHGGESTPRFMMRVVKHYRTALSRQVGEAVRIGRRGGAGMILNSKSEYNRCKIPRLVIEEVDEEQQEKDEARELQSTLELLNRYEEEWGSQMTTIREQEIRDTRSKLARIEEKIESKKREKEQMKGATRKKLKYAVEEEAWGVEQLTPSKPPPHTQGAAPELLPPPPTLDHKDGTGSSEDTPGSKAAGAILIQKTILDYAEQEPPKPAGRLSASRVPPASGVEDESFGRTQNVEEGGTGGSEYLNVNTMREDELRTPGNTTRRIQNVRNTTLLSTPSMGNTVQCNINRKGHCNTHGVKAEKTRVSTTKWKDRGGGRGFGYVTTKSTKFYCKSGIIAKKGLTITEESRNLDMPDSDYNNLTGFVSNLDVGINELESNFRGQVDK